MSWGRRKEDLLHNGVLMPGHKSNRIQVHLRSKVSLSNITTPSLCSDNGLGDADARISLVPPGPRRTAAQTRHDEPIEVIDVDMDELEPLHRPITPRWDIFRKHSSDVSDACDDGKGVPCAYEPNGST
jgi:hypothetical protein